VRATGAVAAALVGPITSLLYAEPPRPDDRDHTLRHCVLGPMITQMDDFEHRFGVKVCVAYGQTEIGVVIGSGWDHGPPANCGTACDDFEVRIVDAHDQPLGPNEVGEMVVRSSRPWTLNVGYHNMPEATAEAWRNGWFHTGDALRYDEDGRFYFVDRLKDAIRRRGENISSFEVESAVMQHPEVLECAAVGIPVEHGDEEVLVAVVVRDEPAFDPGELLEFLEVRMTRFMVPRFVAVVAELPKSETTARVRKNELRALRLELQAFDRRVPGPPAV
jgi:crotonobetaine/carnitine-CoA ligase